MNRDDIIRMAREAGFIGEWMVLRDEDVANLKRFAALVAAAERQKVEAAYSHLAMLHTETMAELAETQRMLWARLNFFQTLALWVKRKLKNK